MAIRKSTDVARRRDRPNQSALYRTIPVVARPSELTPGSRVEGVTVGGALAQSVEREYLSERLAYVRRFRHAYIQTWHDPHRSRSSGAMVWRGLADCQVVGQIDRDVEGMILPAFISENEGLEVRG